MLRKLLFLGVVLMAVAAAGLTLSASPANAVPLDTVAAVKAAPGVAEHGGSHGWGGERSDGYRWGGYRFDRHERYNRYDRFDRFDRHERYDRYDRFSPYYSGSSR